MTVTTSATGIAWDLSDLYGGVDDPAIMATLTEGAAEAAAFAQIYRGSINVPGGPDAEHLRVGLERMEALQDKLSRPAVYAALVFNADTSKPEHRNLQQHIEQQLTAIRNELLFFDLEWLELSDEDARRLIEDPALASYRHYLESGRRYRPHKLSEAEERIVNEKDMTGSSAWQKLFAEITGALSFELELEGKPQRLTLDATLTLLRHPDRAVRRQAHGKLYEELGRHSQTLAYTYNTLMLDHLTMDRLRAYPDPMASRHLANEIEPEAVAAMMQVVEQNYGLAQRYFTLKARLLGLEKLQIFDQYAPLGELKATMAYDQARDAILAAFGAFDGSFRAIAATFYERSWIDAEVRAGKRGGAFCMGWPPSNHPYILCSYTDDLRDVMTVAHELGHGIHFWLARKQTLFNYGPTLPVAETASVFGEMLTFEYLLERQSSNADKLALICGKIEDSFATIFRQNVLTRFEQAAFDGRARTRLTPEQLGERWLEANARYYGATVELTQGYELGWSYISHFINSPFYCYSYVFGNLLVLALLGLYREQGRSFVPRYITLLETGGSQSPAAMLAPLGVDTRAPAFWQKGFDELKRLVDWAEQLAG